VERAIKLSEEKYCSAVAMLGATASITHDFEVRSADAASA
jgi:putative redox protein